MLNEFTLHSCASVGRTFGYSDTEGHAEFTQSQNMTNIPREPDIRKHHARVWMIAVMGMSHMCALAWLDGTNKKSRPCESLCVHHAWAMGLSL